MENQEIKAQEKQAKMDVLKSVYTFSLYFILPVFASYYVLHDLLFNAILDNLTVLFVFLAAICNAIMDVVSHHFNISIFKNKNKQWWDGEVSWLNKYDHSQSGYIKRKKLFWKINYPVQITDAWHLFKTLMIIFWCLSVVFYKPINGLLLDLILFGVIYNCYFSLFYNKLLIKK